MAVTLSPTEVKELTGATVQTGDISDADSYIHAETSYTVDEHNTVRLVSEGACVRAWAIVAARFCASTVVDGSGDIGGEVHGNYSYSRFRSGARVDQQIAFESDPLAGLPSRLLQLASVTTSHLSWRDS